MNHFKYLPIGCILIDTNQFILSSFFLSLSFSISCLFLGDIWKRKCNIGERVTQESMCFQPFQ